MPLFDSILNLPDFTIKKVNDSKPVIYGLECHTKPVCPHCSCEDLRKKDTFWRQVWHESIGSRRVLLKFRSHKFHCRGCARYFRQRFKGILPWQRATEALKRQIYHQQSQGISCKQLGQNFKKSDSTIARYYDRMYHLENQKLLSLQLPTVLGIDEHSFSRKQRFATTFCDLKNAGYLMWLRAVRRLIWPIICIS